MRSAILGLSMVVLGSLLLSGQTPFASLAQRKQERPVAKPATNAASGGTASTVAAPVAGLNTITAAQLRDMLTFIAADEMEGRDTPSRGLDLTAKFIAYHLARWGFKPAGDNGTFLQKFYLQRGAIDLAQTSLEVNGQRFEAGADYLPRPSQGEAKASVVYVGSGLIVKAKGVNSYQGIDVKDKILLVADGAFPAGVQPGDLTGKLGVDYDTALNYAATHGAKGLILIPSPTALKRWDMSQRALSSMRGNVTIGDGAAAVSKLPIVVASEKLLNALLQGEAMDGATLLKQAGANQFGNAFALKAEKQVKLVVSNKTESLPTQNVVAIWEGSDPTLKNEYVAIGAHYDHVGVRLGSDEGKTDAWTRYRLFLEATGKFGDKAGDKKDMLSNGADDDGSGTSAVLSIAEALTKSPRPARSLLLVWHAGEEKGLWGSEYVTDHPPVPLKQIVAQLNIDMIGRSKTPGDTKPVNTNLSAGDEIYVIGSKMMSTDLGALSEAVNNGYLKLKFNYKYDDPNDHERLFYRSDHFNYARKGIPVIFYFDGVHEDYHRVSDEADKIDYAKMERVTRTVFATLWELAMRPQRIKVDKQLPTQFSN